MKMTMEISEIVFAINLSCKQAFEMLFIDVNDKIRYGTWIEISEINTIRYRKFVKYIEYHGVWNTFM